MIVRFDDREEQLHRLRERKAGGAELSAAERAELQKLQVSCSEPRPHLLSDTRGL